MSSQARSSWRWRILILRARIDLALLKTKGALTGPELKAAFAELTAIYHAENADAAVKPPVVDEVLK